MTLNEALGYPWNSKGITTMIHQIFKEFKLEKDYIGKKDINDKKIYSDCSIVEFEVIKGVIIKGFFYFDTDDLSYSIKVISDDTGIITKKEQYNLSYQKDFIFKIIDTIQENKLGLIK